MAYTIADLPGITSGRNFFALGSFNDPLFGTVSVDLISQIDEMFRWDTVRTIVGIDSVVILLTYLNAYPFQAADGELDPITISIGELNEPTLINPLTPDRRYFSDDPPRGGFNDGSILANFTVRPNLRDSVPRFDTVMQADTIYRIDTVMLRVPTLRIPLYGTHDNSTNFSGYAFGRRLLETSARRDPATGGLIHQNDFLSEFPGLYFRTHPEPTPGRGNIVNFDLTNNILAPQIRVYYRFTGRNHDNTADSTRQTTKLYSIGFWNAMTYNRVHFDRSMASQDLNDQLANPGNAVSGQNMVFLQAFFGSLIRVEMPDIRRFQEIAGDSMRMVINQASLVLNPVPNGDRRFSPIPSLGIAFMTDTLIIDTLMVQHERYFWRSLPTRDQGVAIGGGFVERRNEYRIGVTRHIQHLLTDSLAENLPLTIFPINRLLFPEITMISGPPECPTEFDEIPLSDIRRMRLEVVYSLIPK